MKFETTSIRWLAASAINRAGYHLDMQPSSIFGIWRAIAEGHDGLASRGTQIESDLGRLAQGREPIVEGPVLIDAMWRNPNYWLRVALLRSALGTSALGEHALTGRFKSYDQANSARNLGIAAETNLAADMGSLRGYLKEARSILSRIDDSAEILAWKFPEGLPGCLVYDHLLKRQRGASVDTRAPGTAYLLAEILSEIDGVRRVLDRLRPRTVVLSHIVQASYGALAWMAIQRGIETVLAFGNFGLPRFYRLRVPDDIYATANLPDQSEIDALPKDVADALADVGKRHIELRLGGATNDLGARFAFSKNADRPSRAEICDRFGWSPDRRIVAVYAANWFDYPHGFGMYEFRDYLDWLTVTLRQAQASNHVNWLFRGHPCDAWYGGITLADLMQGVKAPHIGLSPSNWHGSAVAAGVDAVITVLGTAGIEYPCIGKPALVADKGWYSQCGFVVKPSSKADYVDLLSRDWWANWERTAATRRACIAAAMYFAMPDDRPGIVCPDDSEQDRLYEWQEELLRSSSDAIESEIVQIRDWWKGGSSSYQVHKVLSARRFRPSNVV